MGLKNSKGEKKKEKGKDLEENKQKTTKGNNLSTKENGNQEEMHESWNDRVLYSKNNDNKITKDDFELLTVIGKGSFGKVSFFYFRKFRF